MPRRANAILAATLLVALFAAGCADAREQQDPPRVGRVPYGWDEDAPRRSFLATQDYYVLTQSSSFLLKGASYGRYVVRVDERFDGVELFFTSTNANAPNATHPAVRDFAYHYEFMQIRKLGTQVRVMDVNAGSAFSNANTGKTFTLAYIYGNGANYQYLAPYEGDPGNWRLDPGYYELVIATDEELTVGINIKLGTPLWTTHYHPQELGSSRGEALQVYSQGFAAAAPRSLEKSFVEVVHADAGEFLNYFAFSDLIYRANVATLGAQGQVRVMVDDQDVPHRLDATQVVTNQPQRYEAYAYAVSFNEPGPVTHQLRTELSFEESASFQSDLAAQMLVFAVAVRPESTLPGIPTA
jgi:hypothetical protein